jgi:hypothetical protein
MDMDAPDSPEDEDRWYKERRQEVIAYLDNAKLTRGAVGDEAAWGLVPHISIWAVESAKSPGWVGWWVVCGDCPTDYVTCDGDRTPRTALRRFASRWREAATLLAQGRQHAEFTVGNPNEARNLAPILAARAEALSAIADDDDAWGDLGI